MARLNEVADQARAGRDEQRVDHLRKPAGATLRPLFPSRLEIPRLLPAYKQPAFKPRRVHVYTVETAIELHGESRKAMPARHRSLSS